MNVCLFKRKKDTIDMEREKDRAKCFIKQNN